MKFNNRLSLLLLVTLFMFSCDGTPKIDYYNLPAFTEDGINVVIEIPAGTNHKLEYQKASNSFENDIENGEERVIGFLPYPANYGFIPSTLLDPNEGGDGDALDVLLIAETLPTGTVVEAKPIAALRLNDSGELDTKIIAVPVSEEQRLFEVKDFIAFMVEYDAAKLIIEEWFLSYKGFGKTELLGWEDENYAIREIKKWQAE